MVPQQDEPQLLPDEAQLINQFARGNGSVFVGAGLSMGAGLPGWADLMKPLSQKVRSPENSSFPDIAQYYVNLHDRPTLVDHVHKHLKRPEVSPTEIHRKLVKLPVTRFFTTNLDKLLESSFNEQRLPFISVVTDEDLALMDIAEKSIIKLHGDLEQPHSWVLTSEDYENYFENHPGVANLLGMDLHSRAVLFLGYSFTDVDLRMILTRVKRVAGRFRKNLFAVQLNPAPLEVDELRRRGVRVISLKAESRNFNQVLKQWLDDFCRRVRESSELQPAARQLFPIEFINSNLPPQRSGDLLGRETDLARVMDGLRSRYPLIAITGSAGVGKTSLAKEVRSACSLSRNQAEANAVIFEYIVWVSAKDKPAQQWWLNDVLNAIATTTNNTAITQLEFKSPEEKEEKEKQVRQLLGSYKVLVIIDNFETINDPELVAWLERLPYPSKAIITSRPRLEQIAAWAVHLKGLEIEEATKLLRQQSSQVGLAFTPRLDRTLHDLARVTDGNPQAMRQALGQGRVADLEQIVVQLDNPGKESEDILRELFLGSWGRLSKPAREILLVTPLFVGVSSIRKDALRATTGLPAREFREGLTQCLKFGLLEEDHGLQCDTQRYVIHPMTRACAHSQWSFQPKSWERDARHRCTEYFREFVRKRVVRPRPEPPYWNALVSVGMKELDPEWASIQQVMAWADEDRQDEVLVELVMLLVHYMDSRFLNLERLEYVGKAVAALQRMGLQEEEALLRIDALGWTYVEVLKLDEAHEELFRGFEIARGEDLRALGLAWRARVRVERKDFERVEEDFARAEELIHEALAIDCSPWIRFRVNMAAGDIALKRGDAEGARAALNFYRRAAREADSYGGEGDGYQIGPRIGLAYLGLGQIKAAERKFKELSSLEQIPVGKLYAEYGLALVVRERGNIPVARLMLNDVKAKLSRRTRSNLLLRLIEEQEARIQGPQGP